MANLEAIVSRKTENDTQWKARQQADRENLMALQDAGVLEITSSAEAYTRYLELQGDNPTYSAGNIALAMVQDANVTVFGTKEKWKMLGRSVPVSENGNGIHIFARSTFGKGYTLADAYDVRQTQGRPLKEVHLENDTRDMESAMTTLLNYAVCQVVIDKELDTPAVYDPQRMELPSILTILTMRCLPLSPQRWHIRGCTGKDTTRSTIMPSPIWMHRAYRICCAAVSVWSATCRIPQICPPCTRAGTHRNGGRRLTKYRR